MSYSFYDPVSRPKRFTREYPRVLPSREQPSSSVEPACTGTAIVSNSVPEESSEASSRSPSVLDTEHLPEMEPITASDESGKENLPETPVERTNLEPETTDAECVPETCHQTGSARCVESESAEGGEATHQGETEIDEGINEEDGSEIQNTVRRSSRQREPAKRLTYPELGNPLVTVVQALFQSLSTAITKSFVEPSFTSQPEPKIV